MPRQCRHEVGLTTTRYGEMTSPNVIRRRCQTLQHHHTLPASLSRLRHDLPTAEACPSTSIPQHASRTPHSERQTTDEKGRWATAHRLSSTLPLPRRAQLGIVDDRLCNTNVHHSKPYRHRSHQRKFDKRYQRHHHHHHQQQQQQQRQAVTTADSRQCDGQNLAFSRASTMRSGNGTINSTSTGSHGYFTDCESDQSKHHHQRQRQHLLQPLTTTARSARRPFRLTTARSSTSTTGDYREFRGTTSSQSEHGDIRLHESVVAQRSAGRSRREQLHPRSQSCDGTHTANNNDTFTRCRPVDAARRTKYANRPYATWSGSSSRGSPRNVAVSEGSEPRRLAWKLQTPHGVLSLRSTCWSETSGAAVVRRSTSADGSRQPTDAQWLTVPRLSRRSSCDGRRSQTLPASFRLRCRSRGMTVTDERISLEPIGRGVETLECEQCYLAATVHLNRSSPIRLHTTLPPLVIDSIAPQIEATGHQDSDKLTGATRRERLHNTSRRQHQVCQKYINDSTATTPSQRPHKPMLTVDSLNSNYPSSCCHCHGIHSK